MRGETLDITVNAAILNGKLVPFGVDGVQLSIKGPGSREWVETEFVEPIGTSRSGHLGFVFNETISIPIQTSKKKRETFEIKMTGLNAQIKDIIFEASLDDLDDEIRYSSGGRKRFAVLVTADYNVQTLA